MVIRRLIVHIEQVMVQVADTALRADPVKSDRFKCQVCHNGIDVVG